jgi:glycosyltransferase involved in cell wall biosynthesis
VVTAIAGIPAMVADGRTGLVVPPGDAGALAAALERLLRDRSAIERFGNAARERYMERYTDKQMARSLESLFVDVVQPQPA